MDWTWLVSNGLIAGDPYYYAKGQATPDEVANAIETAYKNSTDANRKQLVDMMWGTGVFEGDKSYWYADRRDEVASLGQAARGIVPEGGGQELLNAGGKPQVWNVNGEAWLVHVTTSTDGTPLRLAWKVEDQEQLQSYFGPGKPIVYNATVSAMPPDVLDFGMSTELANLTDDPVQAWINQLDVESKTQPWLLDPDYQALSLMAVLENHPLSEAEIASTDWWQNNTSAQRAWMKAYHGDPMTAQKMIDDGRIMARDLLEGAGVANPPDAVINFMADQLTMGEWSQAYFQNQLRAVSDPQSGIKVDGELSALYDSGELDTTRKYETEVRNLYTQWLGPSFGEIDDATASEWAGKFRNDPDATVALTEALKDQKAALFPTCEREMSYESIVSPWRQFVRNAWGETPDENDPMFQSIVNMNNAADASKLLTKEGLMRRNQTVMNRVQSDLLSAFGGTAR